MTATDPRSVDGVLARIRCPEDLRRLAPEELPALAAEIRGELVDSVCRTGGHLGPNLGVVELTIALHRVFRSPSDAVVWDTGHQAYVHKLLTGRRSGLARLRQAGGMSGYPNRAESEHDVVENSHASTALSYADGLAKAWALRGETDRTAVAVVGDGALTGGLAWEALNNLGRARSRPVVVVLNDNGRSYAPTVGGLADHLAALRGGTGAPALFTALGLDYLGPVDGHDEPAVEAALEEARRRRTPTVVHCVTRKGRGHRPAEEHELDCMHSIAPGAAATSTASTSWTSLFSGELRAAMMRRPDVVAVTAAMLDPTGLTPAAQAAPPRVHDVGIAEQHAVVSAAGLAMGGLHPVVAIYATFLNRAFDQVLMDVALHRLPVTFVLDRAGITGNDGPSHHGMWDLSLLGLVPGLRLAAPRDAATLRALFSEALEDADGPTALRFPKGSVADPLPALDRWGRAEVLHEGGPDAPVLLVPVGAMASCAVTAAAALERDGLPADVVDPGWLLPVDPELVAATARYRLVVTLEDNGLAGGYGDALARAMREVRVGAELLSLGLPQRFLPHGNRTELLAGEGLDPGGVARRVRETVQGGRLAVHPFSRRPAQDIRRASAR